MKYEFFIRDSKGQRIEILQQLPDKGDKFPSILLVPGFGIDLHEYGLYDDIATTLVKSGFCSWRFSFAGTGASEGDFLQSTMESQMAQLNDVIAAFLKDRFTSISQVGIAAHGFGAALVIAGLPYPNIQSFVFMSPMAKPFDTISKMYKRQRAFDPDEISTLQKPNKEIIKIGPEFWKSVNHFNIISSIKKATQPTLLIQGTKDYKVKPYEAGQFYSALTTPKKLHLIQRGDHGYTGAFRPKAAELLVEWFEETLMELE